MLKTKICPYCKKTFTTQTNSRKFCKKSCARYDTIRKRRKKYSERAKASKRHMCQWCGKIFATSRIKGFCCDACQSSYEGAKGTIRRTEIRVPVKYTITDVAGASKKSGITYGKYVALHKIR